jgi:uncharacterized RDD family membrane protein YckC
VITREASIDPESTRVSGRRYAAHVIDGVVFGVLLAIVFVATELLPYRARSGAQVVVLILGFTLGQVAYFVLFERRDGRTPGKRLAGIRVVDAEWRTPGTGALVKRTLPLLFEYFYVFAWVSMMASPRRQRFGDRWAGTYVVLDAEMPLEVAGARVH